MEDPTIPAERADALGFSVPEPTAGHPGLDAVMNFEFDRADSIFGAMAAADPRSPIPELGRGSMEWWRLVSGSPGGDPDRVQQHLERARQLSRDYADRPGKRAEALYVSGQASSLLSALELIRGSMMGAYRASQQSRSYLSKCLEVDPSFHDANLGLGLYHYYADALPKYLKVLGWVFGLRGDRELGLRELRTAATRGTRASPEALYFLANVYTNFERSPDRGLSVIRWLVQRYPNNHVFYLEYMSALESLGYYAEAEMLMRRALGPAGHFTNVRAVRLMLGRNLYRQGLYAEGAGILEAIFDDPTLSKDDPVVPWFSYFAGRCRDLMGDRAAAEAHYRRAEGFKTGGNVGAMAEDRRKNPESEGERRMRHARGLLRRGELEAGVEAWRSIVADRAADRIETEIPLAQLRYRLALTLEEAGRYDEAKHEYQLVDDEEFARRAALAVVRCELRAGRTDRAMEGLSALAGSDGDVAPRARELLRHLRADGCASAVRSGKSESDSTVLRHYRESEAWVVEVVAKREDGSDLCVPMTFEEGIWRAQVPVDAVERGYYYRVDRSRAQPDPLSTWVNGEATDIWSIAMVPDPFAKQAEWSGLSMH
jgi:tetratricopeptide (TPR) repeat protein